MPPVTDLEVGPIEVGYEPIGRVDNWQSRELTEEQGEMLKEDSQPRKNPNQTQTKNW